MIHTGGDFMGTNPKSGNVSQICGLSENDNVITVQDVYDEGCVVALGCSRKKHIFCRSLSAKVRAE